MVEVHWTLEEYHAENDNSLVAAVRRGAGICAGMSFVWLQGILHYSQPFITKPHLYTSMIMQSHFDNVRRPEGYSELSGFELIHFEEFNVRRTALNRAWNRPSILKDGRQVGLVIGIMPQNVGNGHAAGFIRRGTCVYLMRPNNGLVSFTSYRSFDESFMEDQSFQELSRNPHRTVIFVLARPISARWQSRVRNNYSQANARIDSNE